MYILIKDFDMPSSCSECPLSEHDWNNHTYCKLKNIRDTVDNEYAKKNKRGDCPISRILTRCGECKHWDCNPNTESYGVCKKASYDDFEVIMERFDFCSYGKENR